MARQWNGPGKGAAANGARPAGSGAAGSKVAPENTGAVWQGRQQFFNNRGARL
jgi:hypothetical protein